MDGRSKTAYSPFREQVKKLIINVPSSAETQLPTWVSFNGYGTTAHAIFPVPLLLGQKVRIKSDTSLWTGGNTAAFSDSTQSFLEKMFKALESHGNVTINSIDGTAQFYPYREGTRFYPYYAGSLKKWRMVEMCGNLTGMEGRDSNNDCDVFASDTLAGAWCDPKALDPTTPEFSECNPKASPALNRTWSTFVDDMCPIKGADGSTRKYSGRKPVGCFSKTAVRDNELSGKDERGSGSDDSKNLCE